MADLTNPLNTNPSLPEDDAGLVVTQADREAAASIYEGWGIGWRAQRLLTGGYDDDSIVQAFAKHRIQSLSTALAEAREKAIEECAKVATSFLVGDPRNGIPLRNPMPHEIAERIRSLTLPEGGE